ncbi:hypothetical protein ACNVED_04120 [Legionella sp. D16C41]|uniref:hypothetical protein n=1 Tax=Legionella sp. D16C41 TaxID=3402688 RepID=UPI003AF784B1
MTLKFTIKLDNKKVRIYLNSNVVTIESIEDYLKAEGYKNIDSIIEIESKAYAKVSKL